MSVTCWIIRYDNRQHTSEIKTSIFLCLFVNRYDHSFHCCADRTSNCRPDWILCLQMEILQKRPEQRRQVFFNTTFYFFLTSSDTCGTTHRRHLTQRCRLVLFVRYFSSLTGKKVKLSVLVIWVFSFETSKTSWANSQSLLTQCGFHCIGLTIFCSK